MKKHPDYLLLKNALSRLEQTRYALSRTPTAPDKHLDTSKIPTNQRNLFILGLRLEIEQSKEVISILKEDETSPDVLGIPELKLHIQNCKELILSLQTPGNPHLRTRKQLHIKTA